MRWLRAQGSGIVADDGQPVVLRGVGLGGWLNMENFIAGYPATESALRRSLRKALGTDGYQAFFSAFLESFFGPQDAAFIASLGLNAVRIPVNYRHWEDDSRPGVLSGEGFTHLDRAIDACAQAGLYSIIDLHAAPGGQNHHWHSDNPFHQPLLWEHPHFQDRAVRLWQAIAGRYWDDPSIAGYNVLNEPADEEGTRLAAFYRRAVAAIREVDPRHIVFLDGNRYAREFGCLGEYQNAVYAVHHYPAPGAAAGGPYPGLTGGEHYDAGRVAAEFRSLTCSLAQRGLPVWVGEFGPVYTGDPLRDGQRRRLLADQLASYENDAGAGWSLWTYKDLGLQGLVTVAGSTPWMRRTAAVRAKKSRLGADHWGGTEDGIRDVMEPVLGRLDREFPGFDPYPFGRRRYAEQLVRNILLAEPLVEEFAACLAGASPRELAALGGSFGFAQCMPQEPLCDVVSAACHRRATRSPKH